VSTAADREQSWAKEREQLHAKLDELLDATASRHPPAGDAGLAMPRAFVIAVITMVLEGQIALLKR
jgi:hypothetical protein